LNAGAKKVYAVDVGYGQLHWRLASDSRVVVMDRTNARELTPGQFGDQIDLAVCDASFISLRLLLPPIDAVLSGSEEGEAAVLIKPQFEAGRERLGRGGVVRDSNIHAAVLREILDFTARETRLEAAGLSWSPLRGPEGNLEFLLHLRRKPGYENAGKPNIDIDAVVAAAHSALT
jgi:23S rRNA (cytidine1920-2'-O)/16S rRNA (cytidine1409-2'-O)-methyltransferase